MSPVVYAVAGGLITALLIWLWRKIIPEVWQRFASDEPAVAGKWKTAFAEDGKQYVEEVELNQVGRKIWGIITLKGQDDVSNYAFDGTFKNLIMAATYASTDRSEIERGAFALRYTRHGDFEGQYVLFAKQSEKLVSSEYKWTKTG